jgi:hypothetical protein
MMRSSGLLNMRIPRAWQENTKIRMTSHLKRPKDPFAPDAGSAALGATAGDALEALS